MFPWKVALEPPGEAGSGSPRNRLAVEVASVTALGSRVRVGLDGPQPLAAEVTAVSVGALGLVAPGRTVVATWKAAATRLTSS